MRSDGVFDFGREDILAARDHHVLHPVANEEIAARVEIARVAGMDPAVGQRCGAFLGLVPIAEHRTRAAYPDLAGRAGCHGLAALVDAATLDAIGGADRRLTARVRDVQRSPGIRPQPTRPPG